MEIKVSRKDGEKKTLKFSYKAAVKQNISGRENACTCLWNGKKPPAIQGLTDVLQSCKHGEVWSKQQVTFASQQILSWKKQTSIRAFWPSSCQGLVGPRARLCFQIVPVSSTRNLTP